MMFSMTLAGEKADIANRGPRYCVSASAGRSSYHVYYAMTADKAEAIRDRLEDEGGYSNIRVHLPDIAGFDLNLEKYGRARRDAIKKADEATDVLRAAVIRAAEAGRAEAEIARSASVDRMTVRKWLGK